MQELQTGFAAINGAQLYYEVAGSGPALTFVHAAIADSGMWDHQFAEFASRYRAIRYDMRGFGKSEPVAGEFAHRDDLVALLDFLGVEQTVLIGCSMGGTQCMDVTVLHPDRVSALVMVGSSPSGFQADVTENAKMGEIEKVWARGEWDRLAELAVEVWFDGEGRTPDQMNPAERAHVLAMSRRAIEHMRKGLGTEKPPIQPSAVEQLGSLDTPTLIVYGDRDTHTIAAAAAMMAEHIPGARQILMHDTAHLPNMEQPAEFNRYVLEFLQAVKVID